MEYYVGSILYLLYGLCWLFAEPVGAAGVIAFLCAVILSCLTGILRRRSTEAVMILVFSAFFPVLKPFSFFMPLCVFLLVNRKLYLPAVLPPILFLASALRSGSDAAALTAGLVSAAAAAVLAYTLNRYREIRQTRKSDSDSSRESEILLEQKNRTLLEKQEYEIHNATLKERNRIAREIHDNVGHMLSRSILLLGALKTLNRDGKLSQLITELEGSLNAAMDSIRESVHDLHDESIDLHRVVSELAAGFTFCRTSLTYDCSYDIPRDVKYTFVAIVKEALANTAKHSSATLVSITVREHPALYQLCIEDNGSGSVLPGAAEVGSAGIGLSNMRERVRLLNGTINITAGSGFRIFVTVPKHGDRKEQVNEA